MDTCCVFSAYHSAAAQVSANPIHTALNLSRQSLGEAPQSSQQVARAAIQETWPPEPTLLAVLDSAWQLPSDFCSVRVKHGTLAGV